jgi:hypothetical protein
MNRTSAVSHLDAAVRLDSKVANILAVSKVVSRAASKVVSLVAKRERETWTTMTSSALVEPAADRIAADRIAN